MSTYGLPDPIQPQPWQVDALCAQVDPETWFPPPGASPDEAIMICHRCPVLAACKEWVMGVETGQPPRARHGIYAGMTATERAEAETREVAA